MTFDGARVPGQGEAGSDGVEVAVDARGEGVEAGQVILPDGAETIGRRSPWRSVSMVANERTWRARASSSGQWSQTVLSCRCSVSARASGRLRIQPAAAA